MPEQALQGYNIARFSHKIKCVFEENPKKNTDDDRSGKLSTGKGAFLALGAECAEPRVRISSRKERLARIVLQRQRKHFVLQLAAFCEDFLFRLP